MANHRRTLRFDPLHALAPPRFNAILVGQVQSVQSFSVADLLHTLQAQWSHLQVFPEVQHVYGNTFVFIFETEEDSGTVENHTQNVYGYLLVLRRWDETSCLRELRFEFASYWVQLHNLPGFCYSEEILWQIAAVAGEAQEVQRRGFTSVRARVLVDIQAPLPVGVIVPRPGRLTDCLVCFKFERLANLCHRCGRIMHRTLDCMYDAAEPIEVRGLQSTLHPYGPWLRALDPTHPLSQLQYPRLYDEEEEEEEDEEEDSMEI